MTDTGVGNEPSWIYLAFYEQDLSEQLSVLVDGYQYCKWSSLICVWLVLECRASNATTELSPGLVAVAVSNTLARFSKWSDSKYLKVEFSGVNLRRKLRGTPTRHLWLNLVVNALSISLMRGSTTIDDQNILGFSSLWHSNWLPFRTGYRWTVDRWSNPVCSGISWIHLLSTVLIAQHECCSVLQLCHVDLHYLAPYVPSCTKIKDVPVHEVTECCRVEKRHNAGNVKLIQ